VPVVFVTVGKTPRRGR